jgi:sialidase-1
MIQKFTVCRDDEHYLAFPDLALTRSGKLVCIISECTHHGNRDYTRIMLTTSTDRGRTWTPKRPLTEPLRGNPAKDPFWNCPRLTALRDGRLVAVVDRIAGRDEGVGGEQSNWLWFSADEGETWDGPHATPAHGIVPDQLIELKSGRWILSAHTKLRADVGNGSGQWWERRPRRDLATIEPPPVAAKTPLPHPVPQPPTDRGVRSEPVWTERCWLSDDQGKTWSNAKTIASVPELMLCEGSIVELPAGELVCFMRENSFQGLDGYKSISRDGGATWAGPYRFPLPACHRPVAGMLQNGQVLITHRFMQGGKGWVGFWTQNLFAALTNVESCLAPTRNGASARILPVDFDRSPHSDTGYSGWVQFPDGEIYIVNYIVDDAPKAQIRGYSLTLADFLLP